jgi:methylated-DNA-[protein]-cysteine S-methyltransferase
MSTAVQHLIFDQGAQMNTAMTGQPAATSGRAARPHDLVVSSPIGDLTLHASGGALTAIDFGGDHAEGAGAVTRGAAPPEPILQAAASQLAAYFAGELREFTLPLRPSGTPFQLAVWEALRCIPYGETVSYGELGARLGRPDAARAVGRANALNPLPVIIPCHRVIGAGGALTGYAGGLGIKRALLDLEAAHA